MLRTIILGIFLSSVLSQDLFADSFRRRVAPGARWNSSRYAYCGWCRMVTPPGGRPCGRVRYLISLPDNEHLQVKAGQKTKLRFQVENLGQKPIGGGHFRIDRIQGPASINIKMLGLPENCSWNYAIDGLEIDVAPNSKPGDRVHLSISSYFVDSHGRAFGDSREVQLEVVESIDSEEVE